MDRGKLKIAIIILTAILLALGTLTLVLLLTDEKEPSVDLSNNLDMVQKPSQSSNDTTEQENDDPLVTLPEDELIGEPSSETEELSELPPESSATVPTAPILPTQGQSEPAELSFPYTIPGTSLVVTKIDSYDGVFLEDGSDRNVSGISTMVLINKGSTDIEYADITVTQGSRQLLFRATVLRAGCTMVVQEATAAAYSTESYEKCTADIAEVSSLEMSASMVSVTENENGTLTVTNLTDKTIPGIRVFYKFCMTKGSVYVGGITYTAKVESLAPGASQQVIPSHYSFGSSEVVMVRVYDTTQF